MNHHHAEACLFYFGIRLGLEVQIESGEDREQRKEQREINAQTEQSRIDGESDFGY
jgi:hypothetical protein